MYVWKIIFSLSIWLVFFIEVAFAIDFDKGQLDAFVKDTDARLLPKKVSLALTVADARTGEVLYQSNGEQQVTPASIQKLITSISALKLLGPAYRFPTDVFVDRVPYPQAGEKLADPRPGHVGNLYLRGYGDPTLVNEQLLELAQAIHRLGITDVKDVIVDNSLFIDPDPPAGDQPYNSGLSAVSLNHNCFAIQIVPTTPGASAAAQIIPDAGFSLVNRVATVAGDQDDVTISQLDEKTEYTTSRGVSYDESFREVATVVPRVVVKGSIGSNHSPDTLYRTVQNPAAYAGQVFRAFLEKSGVTVSGIVHQGVVSPNAVILTRYLSKDLATILKDLNLFSNNFIAGQLFFALGQDETGKFRKDISRKRIYEILSQAGISAEQISIVDGSGYSRDNHLSTDALVKVLAYGYQNFSVGPVLLSSLSRFGESGTLKERFLTSKDKAELLRDQMDELHEQPQPAAKKSVESKPELIPYGRLTHEDIWAKTGTLDGVSSIAGYASSRYGRPMAFAIIINGGIDKPAATKIENEIIRILVGANA